MTDVMILDDLERATWSEALHPRQGGKFAKKGTATAPAAKKVAPAAKKVAPAAPDKSGSAGLSYNGRTGAGYGKKGGDNRVHALQDELNRLGLTDSQGNKLKLDGKLGPRTTAAIKKAQRALGMKVDGVATPALLQKLKSTKGLKVSKPTAGSAKKAVKRTPTPAKKAAPAAKKAAPARKVMPAKGTSSKQLSGSNGRAYG